MEKSEQARTALLGVIHIFSLISTPWHFKIDRFHRGSDGRIARGGGGGVLIRENMVVSRERTLAEVCSQQFSSQVSEKYSSINWTFWSAWRAAFVHRFHCMVESAMNAEHAYPRPWVLVLSLIISGRLHPDSINRKLKFSWGEQAVFECKSNVYLVDVDEQVSDMLNDDGVSPYSSMVTSGAPTTSHSATENCFNT